MKKEPANLTLSFPVVDGDDGFRYVETNVQGVTVAGNVPRARLRSMLEETVAEGLRAIGTDVRSVTVMGCADGTVLVVRFAYDAWQYTIAGPGRNHTCSVCGGSEDRRDQVEDRARRHAAGSYGGVAWECRG